MSVRDRLVKAGATGALLLAGLLATHSEGVRHTVYLDPVKIPTVCYGHTGGDLARNKQYTDADCDRLLFADLRKADAAVSRLVKVPISEGQRAALVDFTFNVGEGRLAGSTLLRKINHGDPSACVEFDRWVYAGDMKLPGLVERRAAERALCEGRPL